MQAAQQELPSRDPSKILDSGREAFDPRVLSVKIGQQIDEIRVSLQGVNPYIRGVRALLEFTGLGITTHPLANVKLKNKISAFANFLTDLNCAPVEREFFQSKAKMLQGYIAELEAITSSPSGLNRSYDEIAASLLEQLAYIENLEPMKARKLGCSPNVSADPASPSPEDEWLN